MEQLVVQWLGHTHQPRAVPREVPTLGQKAISTHLLRSFPRGNCSHLSTTNHAKEHEIIRRLSRFHRFTYPGVEPEPRHPLSRHPKAAKKEPDGRQMRTDNWLPIVNRPPAPGSRHRIPDPRPIPFAFPPTCPYNRAMDSEATVLFVMEKKMRPVIHSSPRIRSHPSLASSRLRSYLR